MAISKKAQAKIDALKNNDEQSTAEVVEFNDGYTAPLEQLTEDHVPPIEVESIDTVLEEDIFVEDVVFTVADLDLDTVECPFMSEGDFRMYGVILPTSIALKHNKEAVDRLICSYDNKDLIRRFIEEKFSYIHILFDGEQYSSDQIETFIIIGQKEYNSMPQIIYDNTKGFDVAKRVQQLKESLKYDLSERSNNIQFLIKNIDNVVNQYLSGSSNDFSELRLNYHKDVKSYTN